MPETVLDFRILGTLEVRDGDQRLTLGSPRQRALLAILVLHRGEVLSSDRLIDQLWGARPPLTAAKIIQGYISQLRKILGDGTLVTRGGGYELAVDREQVDAERFLALAGAGREALAAENPAGATELLTESLALWRGEPLADFAYERFAQDHTARLEEARLRAVEDRIDADLGLGRERDLVEELEQLCRRHPNRERLLGQLMLALYRSGRQADALEAYRRGQEQLRDELGLEPGPSLRSLERRILEQDPGLDSPARGARSTTARGSSAQVHGPSGRGGRARIRGRLLIIGAGALLLAAAVVAAATELAGGHGPTLRAVPNSVAAIDPRSNQVVATAQVGQSPGAIAYGDRSLWIANVQDESLTRLVPGSLQTQGIVRLSQQPTGLAVANGAVWVVMSNPTQNFVTASRVNTQFNDVDKTVHIGNVDPATAPSIAARGDTVLVAPQSGDLTSLRATTGKTLKGVDPNASPTKVAVGAGGSWFTDSDAGDVVHIDRTGYETTLPVGDDPTGVAVGDGAVWVADTADDRIVRINPNTNAQAGQVRVGVAPSSVVFGDGSVWVANSGDGTVSRIDPRTDSVVATIPVGGSPQSVTFARGRVWVTVDAIAVPSEAAARQGGTLRVDSWYELDTTDPAIADSYIDWALLYASCVKLLNYPERSGDAGTRLTPEVARALPTRSSDGLTYTFTIRSGFRFAPPSNEAVTAETFKETIERTLNPAMKSPEATDFEEIAGAPAYMAGRAKHISGVIASGDKLTIRLTKPNPLLPTQLALPFFCAVPSGTPIDPHGVAVIASAGPYTVRSFSPSQDAAVLVRNTNYHGSRPHHFDRIDISGGVLRQTAVHAVESGAVDLADEGEVTAASARDITARYGARSPAASHGHQQAFIRTQPELDFFSLNTHRPLFSHRRLRQAVNYAIDRSALARLGDQVSNLPDAPFDHYLPPGVPGYRHFNAYPNKPDLRRARQLAKGFAGSTVVLYTCDTAPCPQQAQIVKTDLAAIGLRVHVRTFGSALYPRLNHPGEPYDMADNGWFADYADPYDFLNLLLEDGSVIPTFEDPGVRSKLARVAELTGPERYLAYAKLDQRLTTGAAPFVVWGNSRGYDLFSARIGCETYSPVYGTDLAALCLRRKDRAAG